MGSAKLGLIACLFLLFGKSVAIHAQADETYKTVSTPDDYNYISLNANGLELQSYQKSFTFVVKANNDAHVALYEGNTNQNMYEIVIGGWANRRSAIRTGKQVENRVLYRHPLHLKPLSEQEFRSFWISWKDELITVGTGCKVGSKDFMSWRNPNPFAINYISVSTGWGSTGVWRFVTDETCKHGYAKHPGDCSKFFQCAPGREPTCMSCGPGTLWYQPYLTCWHANMVTCDVKNTPTAPVASCANGKRPVQGNRRAFELFKDGLGWTWNQCPSGKEFDVAKCECVLEADD